MSKVRINYCEDIFFVYNLGITNKQKIITVAPKLFISWNECFAYFIFCLNSAYSRDSTKEALHA